MKKLIVIILLIFPVRVYAASITFDGFTVASFGKNFGDSGAFAGNFGVNFGGWFNLVDNSTRSLMMGKLEKDTTGYWMFLNPGTGLVSIEGRDADYVFGCTGTTNVTSGWHHVAAAYVRASRHNVTLWVDGVQECTKQAVFLPGVDLSTSNNASFTMGTADGTGSYDLKGSAAHAYANAIGSAAAPISFINQLMTVPDSHVGPSGTNRAYWPMMDINVAGSGTVFDASGNNFIGTIACLLCTTFYDEDGPNVGWGAVQPMQ